MSQPAPPLGLLVTRPAEEAAVLAESLQARGYRPILSPVLTIVPQLDSPLPDLSDYCALLLTSANGARVLAQKTGRRNDRLLAVGDHTAACARELGFTRVEHADGDAAALTAYIATRFFYGEGKLLHIRGETVAADPALNLSEAGFVVETHIAYRAEPSDRLSAAAVMALQRGEVLGVLLYSSRSAKFFEAALIHSFSPKASESLQAYCLSPAIAETLSLAYRHIAIAPSPRSEALLGLLPAVSSVTQEKTMSETNDFTPKIAAQPAPALPKQTWGRVFVTGFLGGVVSVVLAVGAGWGMRDAWLPSLPPPPMAPDRSLTLRLEALERGLAAQAPSVDEAGLRAELEARLADQRLPTPDHEAIEVLQRRIEAIERGEGRAVDASKLAVLSEHSARLSAQMADLQRASQLRSAQDEATRALVKQASSALAALRVSSALAQGLPFTDALRLLTTLGAQDDELRTALSRLDPLAGGVPTAEALRARFPALTVAVKTAELAMEESGWRREVARFMGHLITIRRTDSPTGDGLDARLARLERHLLRSEWEGVVQAFEGVAPDVAAAAAPFLADVKLRQEAERLADWLLDHTFVQLAKVGT